MPETEDPSRERDKLRALNETLTEKLLDKDTTIKIQQTNLQNLEAVCAEKETLLAKQREAVEKLELEAKVCKEALNAEQENLRLTQSTVETFKQSHDKLSSLQEDNSKLKLQLDDGLQTIYNLEEKITILEKQIIDLTGEKKTLEEEHNHAIENLTNDINRDKIDLERLNQEVDEKCQLIEDLQLNQTNSSLGEVELSESRTKLASVNAEMELKQEELTQSQELVQTLKTQLEDWRQEQDVELEGLRQSLVDKEFEINKAKEASQSLVNQIEALNTQLELEQNSRLDLSQELASKSSQLESISVVHNQEAVELKTEIEKLSTEITSMNDKDGSESESLRLELNETIEREKGLVRQLQSLKQENLNLAILRDQLNAKETELSQNFTQTIETLSSRDNELALKVVEFEQLKQSSSELTQALTDLKGMNELILNSAREKEKEMNATKQTIAQLEAVNEQLNKELAKLSEEMELRSEHGRRVEVEFTEYKARTEAEIKELKDSLENEHQGEQEQDNHLVQVENNETRID